MCKSSLSIRRFWGKGERWKPSPIGRPDTQASVNQDHRTLSLSGVVRGKWAFPGEEGFPGGGGHSSEVWVVVCCRGLQTLPLFILLSCLKLSNFF